MTSQYHFVLLHGGCFGAWAWFPIEARLQKAGHKVTAMDFAGAGIHPADANDITTFDEFHKPALDFFESLPENPEEKVVLVGHSMAGFALAQIMERFSHKISFAVFIAAVLSSSGVPLTNDTPLYAIMTSEDAPRSQLQFNNGVEKPPTSFYFPISTMKHMFFSEFDSEDMVVLASKLCRSYPIQVFSTALTYTKERYGQVPSVYIKYLNDNTFTPPAQDYVSSKSGPFKEIIEIEGGHFNHLKRPDEFVRLLESLAKKYIV
ncbi:hypothetical protein M758_6G043300 [Ceratodon purpureus]|uniref:AB hydrolase-1 domain-containing protein n=1 Tax=Ceratodon purpureus TaxID=3225 RepID=A0A8T0HEU6_CERPU|nr:hypothetical protein KC19_6G043400 [Ceratodon purpureus]KAG0612647.1 hypothetical protein M758_6G043300 [Ceratodon purpureus]